MVAFLLAEAGSLVSKLREISHDPNDAIARIEGINRGINKYFSIKIAVSFLTGVLVYTLLWVVGVDHPALWAFLAFLLNFVPNIGSFLAAIPAILLALVQPELGGGSALVVAVGFALINIVIGSVLEPRIMGRGLDLSNLVVFLSLLFWGWVLGPVGMLLSVPLTVAAKIILEAFPEGRPIARILGSGGSQ
jgi:predicted PurR-regulated permease PerM